MAESGTHTSILVMGVGNALMQDDAVGTHVTDALRASPDTPQNLEIIVNSWGAPDLKSRAFLVKRIGIAMFCWVWSLEQFLFTNLAIRLCLASRVTFYWPSQSGYECSD